MKGGRKSERTLQRAQPSGLLIRGEIFMIKNLHRQGIVWGALVTSLAILAPASGSAAPQTSPNTATRKDQSSMYHEVLVDRTVKAVKYAHRSGSTKIDFQGTNLMGDARGVAVVDSHRGSMEIKAEFSNMQKPTTFGAEYLTYVMWAISPEGRAVNLGEVLIGGNDRSKLEVTTDLQAFAMIVTAEPYYAVRRPSNVVVMENEIRPDTVGTSEVMDAKYELIDRGGYIPTGYKFDPVILNAKLPLEFFEARNALRIAQSAGAEDYAASSYANAATQMKQADDMAINHRIDKKVLSSTSRLVVQTAEDAREIAVKRIDEERAEAARAADASRIASAVAGERSAESETADANRAARLAAAGQAQADMDNAAAQQQKLAAQADADRNRAAAADANQANSDAQQHARDAEADSAASKVAAANSDQQLQQALRDREELRARLLIQFNTILQTRDTARGLVVNMSDVLFDSAKFTLRPAAREKLAKISGIILAYPTLELSIEGNTDSVGGDSYNQELSENRAGSVRDYLAKAGIPVASMKAQGFGKSQPIASNDTADGRQQNRRVELVVSGEVIGTVVGSGSASMDTLPLSPRQ
jgi:outer membrane protein OmpA-like peptidoglycan-associated protein